MSGEIRCDQEPQWFDLSALMATNVIRRLDFRGTAASTNTLALEAASDDLPLPLLVLTERQMGGRGRGSNQWWATDGALTFSLLVDPADYGISLARQPLISLTTAIAVADTLNDFVRDGEIGLKWPNDVHLNQRKICGILVEPAKGRSDRLVIGIGLNVGNSLSEAPEALRSLATSLLDETGTAFGLTEVLARLLTHWQARVLELGRDQLPLPSRWAKQCVLTGKEIRLDAGDQVVTGTCRGLAANGGLLIETDGSLKAWFGGVVRVLQSPQS